MFRKAGLLAATLALALMIGCVAQPDVDQYVSGSAQIWVTGADRALYRVEVGFYATKGVSTNGGDAYLTFDVAQCKGSLCAAPTQYISPLSPAGYDSSDLKNLVAKYQAFGGPITVSFVGAGPADAVDRSPSVSGGTNVSLSSTWDAVARVTIFGVTCEDKAAKAGRHTTAYGGGYSKPANRKGAPLGKAAGTPSGPSRCAAPAKG